MHGELVYPWVCAAVLYRYRAAGEHPITSDLLKVGPLSADECRKRNGHVGMPALYDVMCDCPQYVRFAAALREDRRATAGVLPACACTSQPDFGGVGEGRVASQWVLLGCRCMAASHAGPVPTPEHSKLASCNCFNSYLSSPDFAAVFCYPFTPFSTLLVLHAGSTEACGWQAVL
jgi:hypothetical protein